MTMITNAPIMPMHCPANPARDARRRALMIAAAFPPTGGPGVQRSAKFAKYLPSFGWLPTVWTVEHLEGLPVDATLSDDLPDCVSIHRTPAMGGTGPIRRHLRSLGSSSGLVGRVASGIEWRLSGLRDRRSLPDKLADWARVQVGPVCDVVARQGIEVIYSTFSPASNHLLGLHVKRRTGLPWVADFRDLWTDDYRYVAPPRRRHGHRRLEQEILETADAVVGVTKRQTEVLAGHVPETPDKFVTITNGFDPDDFGRVGTVFRDLGFFVLGHVGRFDRWRSSEAWFAGLRGFVQQLGGDAGRFRLHVVGHCSGEARQRLLETGATCCFTGHVSHEEAVRSMLAADALLLNIPDGPNADSVIPGKQFEYLASGRPILVVGPAGGECERLVADCGAGLTADFNAARITSALARLFEAWRNGTPYQGCPAERLAEFSRATLAGKLAAVLDGLVRRVPAAPVTC